MTFVEAETKGEGELVRCNQPHPLSVNCAACADKRAIDLSNAKEIGVGTCPAPWRNPVRYQLAEVPRTVTLMTPVTDGRKITRIDYHAHQIDVAELPE